MTPEQIQEIARLRELHLSPKQIARQLGLRPAEVTNFLRAHATETALSRISKGELAPLHRCLINQNAAHSLLGSQRGWLSQIWSNKRQKEEDEAGGMAQIFVSRLDRNQYLLSSYLVDYWCLGVKDAFGPKKLDRLKYETLVERSYKNFEQGYQEITLEQAQAIVFGAVDYAATLGFKPHADFELAKTNLGRRLDHLQSIKFGRDGKPFYISGPYDKPERILATLRTTVGEGNFDYLMNIEPDFF